MNFHMAPPPREHERLLRLLALKRHEVPPPGYFDRFADRVVLQIKAGQAPAAEAWWIRLRDWLRAEPALASSYAMLLAGGMFFLLSLYHLADHEGASGLSLPASMPAPAMSSGPGEVSPSFGATNLPALGRPLR